MDIVTIILGHGVSGNRSSNISYRTVNHKQIGLGYICIGLLAGVSGTITSVIMRIELEASGTRLIDSSNLSTYNLLTTLHGLLMIFFLIMPVLWGTFGNIYVPVLIGASEVTYPRINNLSIILLPLAYIVTVGALTQEHSTGQGTGWTLYPTLSTSLSSLSTLAIGSILTGLIISGSSSTLTSLNF
jgi:cytochrome c oxidase subunit 1